MRKCPFCAEEIQDEAIKCKHCGELLSPKQESQDTIECPSCGKQIVPIVTSVGGGTCSFGRRDKFYCPLCRYVIKTKGCFIATATYESADTYEVLLLRKFRDNVLKRSFGGRLLIFIYYSCSPYIAEIVENSRIIKLVARKFLDKLVKFIERFEF